MDVQLQLRGLLSRLAEKKAFIEEMIAWLLQQSESPVLGEVLLQLEQVSVRWGAGCLGKKKGEKPSPLALGGCFGVFVLGPWFQGRELGDEWCAKPLDGFGVGGHQSS